MYTWVLSLGLRLTNHITGRSCDLRFDWPIAFAQVSRNLKSTVHVHVLHNVDFHMLTLSLTENDVAFMYLQNF